MKTIRTQIIYRLNKFYFPNFKNDYYLENLEQYIQTSFVMGFSLFIALFLTISYAPFENFQFENLSGGFHLSESVIFFIWLGLVLFHFGLVSFYIRGTNKLSMPESPSQDFLSGLMGIGTVFINFIPIIVVNAFNLSFNQLTGTVISVLIFQILSIIIINRYRSLFLKIIAIDPPGPANQPKLKPIEKKKYQENFKITNKREEEG